MLFARAYRRAISRLSRCDWRGRNGSAIQRSAPRPSGVERGAGMRSSQSVEFEPQHMSITRDRRRRADAPQDTLARPRPQGSLLQAGDRRDRHRLRRHRHLADLRVPRDLRRPPSRWRVDQLHIHGVLSLIFWSMMIIVTLKYVTIIMRADNKGEGGSLALLALINRTRQRQEEVDAAGSSCSACSRPRCSTAIRMITPAISVLSAVEGLTTVNAGLHAVRRARSRSASSSACSRSSRAARRGSGCCSGRSCCSISRRSRCSA